MMKEETLEWMGESWLKEVGSRFENQLWRYYDIEVEVERIVFLTNEGTSAFQVFNLYCNSEIGEMIFKVKAKVHNTGVVEDFYLFDPEINGWMQPTTTEEQQQLR